MDELCCYNRQWMEPELFFNTTTTQGNTNNLYEELSRSSTWEAFTEAQNYYTDREILDYE